MARTARKPKDDDGGVVQSKDFDRAKKYYFEDIKPARSKASEFMQEVSTAFKAVKKICGIQPGAMKAALKLVEMEEAKREDWLRSFNGVLRNHNIDPDPKDMVDQMQAEDGYARPKPALVAVPLSDGEETDLADAAGGEQFEESSEEELARQEGRGGETGED
jgi:hypothetical protein